MMKPRNFRPLGAPTCPRRNEVSESYAQIQSECPSFRPPFGIVPNLASEKGVCEVVRPSWPDFPRSLKGHWKVKCKFPSLGFSRGPEIGEDQLHSGSHLAFLDPQGQGGEKASKSESPKLGSLRWKGGNCRPMRNYRGLKFRGKSALRCVETFSAPEIWKFYLEGDIFPEHTCCNFPFLLGKCPSEINQHISKKEQKMQGNPGQRRSWINENEWKLSTYNLRTYCKISKKSSLSSISITSHSTSTFHGEFKKR